MEMVDGFSVQDISKVIIRVMGWENHFVASKFVCTAIIRLSASSLANVLIMKSECGKRVFSQWPQWLAVGDSVSVAYVMSYRIHVSLH